ncbi:MAG: hypothetical protein RL514_3108 [Verrucomicrobiota bacterium]|jgi:uncharacterized membrane protein
MKTPLAGIASLLLISLASAAATDSATEVVPKLFQWRPFLAPFHAVVLHFPIGFLTMAGILEIYRVFRPSVELRRVTVLVLGLGLLTGIIAAVFGFMRAGSGGYEAKALELHRLSGMAVPFVTAAALALQWLAYRDEAARGWTRAYRGLLVGTLALVVVAGHQGGNLTHGSRYLVENAPEFVRDLLAEEPAATSAGNAAALDAHQRYYRDKVEPLLKAKCLKCHGAEKQKGGYRLDSPELAFKAGESGKLPIKPGDPLGSHLVHLILLPPQHDDVMPPAGKEPLALDEIMTLLDWIRNGAAVPSGETNRSAAAAP